MWPAALFGILRKGFQHDAGFLLPGLPHNDRGFAQFINRNHFAFLIEMTFGLALAMIIGEQSVDERHAAVRRVAIAAVGCPRASGSRGGILATLCQLLFLGVLLDPVRHFLQRVEK